MSSLENAAKPDNGNDIATIEEKERLWESDRQGLAELIGQAAGPELHNFIGSKIQVYRKVALATNGPKIDGRDMLGNKIDLTNFFIHRASKVNPETGELNEFARTILIDREGVNYVFSSVGIAQSLARLLSVFGKENWPNPFWIDIVPVKTSSKRIMFALVPAE